MGTIRCPYCHEHIDSAVYPGHEADHREQQRKHGVTGALPGSIGRVDEAFTLQPDGNGAPKQLNLRKEEGQEPQEFVVRVVHSQSGRVFSPFIVSAKDEAAARKMCQRNYLMVESVERYIEQEGIEKPRILPYGPPVSDRDFELDYGSRPADTPASDATPYLLASVGWLFCGPAGAVLGWWAGSSSRDRRAGD